MRRNSHSFLFFLYFLFAFFIFLYIIRTSKKRREEIMNLANKLTIFRMILVPILVIIPFFKIQENF